MKCAFILAGVLLLVAISTVSADHDHHSNHGKAAGGVSHTDSGEQKVHHTKKVGKKFNHDHEKANKGKSEVVVHKKEDVEKGGKKHHEASEGGHHSQHHEQGHGGHGANYKHGDKKKKTNFEKNWDSDHKCYDRYAKYEDVRYRKTTIDNDYDDNDDLEDDVEDDVDQNVDDNSIEQTQDDNSVEQIQERSEYPDRKRSDYPDRERSEYPDRERAEYQNRRHFDRDHYEQYPKREHSDYNKHYDQRSEYKTFNHHSDHHHPDRVRDYKQYDHQNRVRDERPEHRNDQELSDQPSDIISTTYDPSEQFNDLSELWGFREQYHKDEHKKSDSWFSNKHKSGEWLKYGVGNTKHHAFKHDKDSHGKFQNAKHQDKHGKETKYANGHAKADHKAHKSQHGGETHYVKHDEYAKKKNHGHGKQ